MPVHELFDDIRYDTIAKLPEVFIAPERVVFTATLESDQTRQTPTTGSF